MDYQGAQVKNRADTCCKGTCVGLLGEVLALQKMEISTIKQKTSVRSTLYCVRQAAELDHSGLTEFKKKNNVEGAIKHSYITLQFVHE